MIGIFDTCDKEGRRTPSLEEKLFACLFEGICPYKHTEVRVKTHLYGYHNSPLKLEHIERMPMCGYYLGLKGDLFC